MELEFLELRKAVRHGYQVLLRVEGELFLPKDFPKIRDFYEALSNTCLSWAHNRYGEELKAAYSALESNKERARFPTQKYQLCVRRCFEDEHYVAFLCESALKAHGTGDRYRRVSHVWNKQEESILPQAQILKAFGFRLLKKDLPFSPDGIFPEGEHLVLFRNATLDTPFAEKKLSLKKTH